MIKQKLFTSAQIRRISKNISYKAVMIGYEDKGHIMALNNTTTRKNVQIKEWEYRDGVKRKETR